ncbi:hypothetical protein EKM00_10855 [Flavobacterium sp. RSP15]|nr:hypothetical protein [Flavobacterium sp. RSP15]RTY86437.1 hypothetical protein EKM00_10855 [Flavobacterium sp. RSP15]
MLKSIRNSIQKKSLKERFFLVLGILFFLVYLVLGLFIIFMKEFPIEMDTKYRIVFGLLLIVYSFFRFIRLINSNN